MGFDFTGMNKAGPGVAPGAPRKKGFARLAEVLGRDFGSLFLAGLAAFAALLPAALGTSLGLVLNNFWITLLGGLLGGAVAGPVVLALWDIILRTLQDDPTPWKSRWVHTLTTRAKPAAVTGAVGGLLLALGLFTGHTMLAAVQAGTLPAPPVWVMLLFDAVVLLVLLQGVLPQLCLGDGTLPGPGTLLKNSALLFLRAPLRGLGAALLRMAWYGLLLALFPTSVLFAPLIGFWPPALCGLSVLYPALEKQFEIPAYTVPATAKPSTIKSDGEIWWRRHWGFMLAGLCVICGALGVVQVLVSRTEPDVQIAIVAPDPVPEEVLAALKTSLTPYAQDVNGDGKTVVQVNDYTVELAGTAKDPDLQTAGQTLLVTDLSAGDSTVWVLAQSEAFLEIYGDKVDGTAARLWQACPTLTALDAGHYSTAVDIDTDQAGQDVLQNYTVLPAAADRTLFDALTAQ